MLAKIAAADSARTVIKKYSVFIYSEAEPHAKYAIYKHTRKFRVLQYSNSKKNVFFLKTNGSPSGMKQSTTNYMQFILSWVCGLEVLESIRNFNINSFKELLEKVHPDNTYMFVRWSNSL